MEILKQGIKAKQSANYDLYNVILASKSTQKKQQQEIYCLIGQFSVMASAISKTKMMPSGHVFPDREIACDP